MKISLYAGAAALALVAGSAHAGGHLAFADGEGPFSWDSYNEWASSAPDLSGQTVTISGPWLQPEDDAFRNVIAYFADATGAEVIYTGSDSFEQQIRIDAEAGSDPGRGEPARGERSSSAQLRRARRTAARARWTAAWFRRPGATRGSRREGRARRGGW